jgi:hypothetical protein
VPGHVTQTPPEQPYAQSSNVGV